MYANDDLAWSVGVFFERAIWSRKRHVETSRREEEMGRVKGTGKGALALAPTVRSVRVTIGTLPNLSLLWNQRLRLQQHYEHEQGFDHPKYACTEG